MREIVVIFLCAWLALPIALTSRAGLLMTGSRPPASSTDGDVTENYEATGTGVNGFDMSGWVLSGNNGSITNANYATAPAPFEGAQSLNLAHTGFDQILTDLDMFPSSSVGTNEMSFYFTCYWRTQFVGTTFFALGATNSDFMIRLETTTGGAIRIYTGSNANAQVFPSANSTGITLTNVLYHIWGNYAKGSSAVNSTGQIWFATNSNVRPADGAQSHLKMVNGTNGFNVEHVFVMLQNFSQLSDNVIFDKLRVRKGPIANIDAIIP